MKYVFLVLVLGLCSCRGASFGQIYGDACDHFGVSPPMPMVVYVNEKSYATMSKGRDWLTERTMAFYLDDVIFIRTYYANDDVLLRSIWKHEIIHHIARYLTAREMSEFLASMYGD
jgi:hypothetical protein